MSFASRSTKKIGAFFGAAAIVALGAALVGCPKGACFVRLKTVENGKTTSDKCIVDSCPKNATFVDAKNGCDCNKDFVTYQGACVTVAEANASCGAAYQYANGGCVAKVCPKGQIINSSTGACESRSQSDKAVAQQAGVTLKEGQSVGCPAGYTYVVNGSDGACVPNELTCGTGTKYQNGSCVSVACPAGQVYDAQANGCVKLAQGDDKIYSVQAKLKASMGPDFCAPHAKNPSGFNVQPGQSQTIKVSVTINVPGNDIEQAAVAQVRVTNLGGAELTPQVYPGVAKVQAQVNTQVLSSIKALGGKSTEASATAEVTCVIKRAPIQVVETHGGGV
ncbi:MAG: hypothetical protein ACXVEF_24680 [Polyangiales bacterium]